MIPLRDLCDIRMEDGIYEIRHLDRERRALVQCNVRGRDLASFVAAGKQAFDEQLDLPEGYRVDWGGTYENLRSAVKRMMIVLPLSLALIFLLLYATFGSMKLGLLIFLSVPFAAIGGVWLLFLRGIDFSISAGIGFICPGRRLGPRRPGPRLGDPRPPDRASGEDDARGRLRGVDGAAPADPDDRPGRQPRLRADGLQHRHRRRGPAPARHRRRRRDRHQHPDEADPPAGHLPLVRPRRARPRRGEDRGTRTPS